MNVAIKRYCRMHAGQRRPFERLKDRWANVVLSNFKHSLGGAYHAFKFARYAHRYLAETMWRFSCRFDLSSLVPSLPAAASAPWPGLILRAANPVN